MTEAFLHYIWKHQLFERSNLFTTDGLALEILKPGEYNQDGGPDFFSAQVRVNNTLWVGTVEIHMRASEWKKHRHEQDAAYDNCILHVVFDCDAEAYRKNGQAIFCLELKNRFSERVWENYQSLIGAQAWIPCGYRIKDVANTIWEPWLEFLAEARLQAKSENILIMLERNNNDWEETFYQYMCSCFGFQLNSLPMMMLSRLLPYRLVQKHRDKPIQLEALIFGCAGFLSREIDDNYSRRLQFEFEHLKNAYSLSSLDVSCWKFLRLRPGNFPTVRLAQLAALFSNSGRLFPQILNISDWNSGRHLLRVRATEYWDTHFLFGTESVCGKKELGQKSVESVFINAVIPFLFTYGKRNDSSAHTQIALSLLQQIPAENNSIVRNWAKLGLVPSTAMNTQALLELKKNYCSQKKCLTCRVGIELINLLP